MVWLTAMSVLYEHSCFSLLFGSIFARKKNTYILEKNLNLFLQYKPNVLRNKCLNRVVFVLRSPTGSLLVTLYQALILSAAKTRRLFTGSSLVPNLPNKNNELRRKNIWESWDL